jgi:hypothetical protein
MEATIGLVVIAAVCVMIALFAVIFLISLRSLSRPAVFSSGTQMSIMLINFAALAVYLFLTGVMAGPVAATLCIATGVGAGILLGRTSGLSVAEKGVVHVRRTPYPALLSMVAYQASVFFNILGGHNSMSLGVLLVLFATALAMASGAVETVRGLRLLGGREVQSA